MKATIRVSEMIGLAMALGFVGCLSERQPEPASTVSAWNRSVWISAADAKAASAEQIKKGRAADGTDWFVREIVNEKAIRSAIWTTAGLGVYELYVNGKPVGSQNFLKPGFTHNEKTKYTFTYDITESLRKGAGARNVIKAEVSSGWWRDQVVAYTGKISAFRSALTIVWSDGTESAIVTGDDGWRAGVGGPVTHAGIFDGEEFDARISAPEVGSPMLKPPVVNREFNGAIMPSYGAEVVARYDLAMKRGPFTVRPGENLVIDFGQNCAGVPRFSFKAKRGTVLTALPAEMLNDAEKGKRGSDGPIGSAYRENLRNPENQMRVVYTFAGDAGGEHYMPRFTFFGYRYLSVSASDEVAIESVETIPVSSISKEMELGEIKTGNADVNRLIANVYWGQLSNYLSVPTDCPQRDERQGWSADTQVFCEAGSFNANTRDFLRKWMHDMIDTQHDNGAFVGTAPFGRYGDSQAMRLGWSDAGIIVPWTIWRQFGDTRIISESWEGMEKFMAQVARTKYDHAANKADNLGYQWADWLSFEQYESHSWAAFDTDAKGNRTPKPEALVYWNYLSACYWVMDAEKMVEMAKAIGRDAAKYERMKTEARQHLREKFLESDGMIVKCLRGMQTPALFALKLKLVEGAARENTIASLKRNFEAHGGCLQTGFLGTSIIMDTLTENGMVDIAYDLLFQHKSPSWLYSVDQGATTIWERWNSYTKTDGFGPVDMNSFNHYAYGAVLAWIYKTAAGISADANAPGFKNIIMRPIPDKRLGFVKATYKSAAGEIKSEWKYEGEKWIWNFTIPQGTTASVRLPGEVTERQYRAGTHRIEK